MLVEDHERYHKMSPKDVGLKDTMPLQLSRVTAETGEQFTFEVPIYPDDSREMVNDRVNFAMSIMQDRMEDVNKAMLEVQKKAKLAHEAQAAVNKVRALEKRLKRGKITQEQFDQELAELNQVVAAGEIRSLKGEVSDEEEAEAPEEGVAEEG